MNEQEIKQAKYGVKVFSIALLIIVGIIGLFQSFTIVDGGHRGVVISKISGVQDEVLGEGFHWKLPYFERVQHFEVRTQKYQIETVSTTKDQQVVDSTIALNFNIEANQTSDLYQDIGVDYKGRILNPSVKGAVKSIMAGYEASELIQNRTDVSNDVGEELKNRLDIKFLQVTDFNLVDISFSPEYTKAIEQKVVAEQQVLKEKRILEKVEIQQQQKVKRAQAEAEAKLIQAEADQKAILLRQKSLQGSPEYLSFLWLERWNGVVPNVVGSENNGILLNMDLNTTSQETNRSFEVGDLNYLTNDKTANTSNVSDN